MKSYGFIFARGGSKGLPGKNIRPLCGKPLIAWAIEAGQKCGRLEKIIVSTDSPEIAAIARKYGAETPFLRPAELAADTADEILAWRHAVGFLRDQGDDFDLFVSIPATAPLRTPQNICDCIDKYLEGDCDMVITYADPYRNPYYNMITLDADGYTHTAIPGYEHIPRRQDVPRAYDMSCVAYVTSPGYIMDTGKNPANARFKAVKVERINALDIDEALDFEIAEFFMQKRLDEEKKRYFSGESQ